MDILQKVFWGNSMQNWLIALLMIPLSYVILRWIKNLFIKRIGKVVKETLTLVDDVLLSVIKGTREPFLVWVSFYIASRILAATPAIDTLITKSTLIIVIIQVGLWLSASIDGFIIAREENGSNKKEKTALHAFGLFGKIFLWLIIGLLGIQNVTGMRVDALIASFGVGGIAVSLALQSILKDIFASLSIFLDKPFLVGDYIVVGDIGGTVTSIGIKSTRIRTLLGEEVIFSNSDLLESRVHNYRVLTTRREVITLGVSTETSVEILESLQGLFRDAIQKLANVQFGRAHLAELGDFSYLFEIVYFIESSDYDVYMDAKQAVNLALLAALNEKGVILPFPTQAIVMNK